MAVPGNVPTAEFDTEWCNYWDANPEDHGGTFLRWDPEGEYWKIVQVQPWTHFPEEIAEEDEYYICQYWVYPDDVWVNSDPEEGFTDDMESILESLDAERHKQAPGGEPFISRIGYYVADFPHLRTGRGEFVDSSEYDSYDDMVADYGVSNWE